MLKIFTQKDICKHDGSPCQDKENYPWYFEVHGWIKCSKVFNWLKDRNCQPLIFYGKPNHVYTFKFYCKKEYEACILECSNDPDFRYELSGQTVDRTAWKPKEKFGVKDENE